MLKTQQQNIIVMYACIMEDLKYNIYDYIYCCSAGNKVVDIMYIDVIAKW